MSIVNTFKILISKMLKLYFEFDQNVGTMDNFEIVF